MTRLAIAAFSAVPLWPLVTKPGWQVAFKELSESELGGESADANARPDNLMRWEGRRFEHFGCNHLATNYLVFNFKRYFCLSVLGKPQTNEAFLSRKSFVLANRGSPDLLWIYPDTNIEHAFLCFFAQIYVKCWLISQTMMGITLGKAIQLVCVRTVKVRMRNCCCKGWVRGTLGCRQGARGGLLGSCGGRIFEGAAASRWRCSKRSSWVQPSLAPNVMQCWPYLNKPSFMKCSRA